MSSPRFISSAICWQDDFDPDASYLEQGDFEDRLAQYRDGVFRFVGCFARAVIEVDGIRQIVRSGGLWGIESNIGAEYRKEIEDEQMADLQSILAALGIDTGP